jgi:hypothetical protein
VPAAGRGDAFQNGWSGCLITGMTIVVGFGIRGEAVCGRGRAARGVGAVTNWAVCFSEKGFSEKGSTAGPKRRRPAVQGCNRSIVQPVIVAPRGVLAMRRRCCNASLFGSTVGSAKAPPVADPGRDRTTTLMLEGAIAGAIADAIADAPPGVPHHTVKNTPPTMAHTPMRKMMECQ